MRWSLLWGGQEGGTDQWIYKKIAEDTKEYIGVRPHVSWRKKARSDSNSYAHTETNSNSDSGSYHLLWFFFLQKK